MKSITLCSNVLRALSAAALLVTFSPVSYSAGLGGPPILLAMGDDMDKMKPMQGKPGMGMEGMGKMGKPMAGMAGKPKSANATAPDASDGASANNLDMMGRMRGPAAPNKDSAKAGHKGVLPGFPGVPHLYHVGAVDFFLDRTEASLDASQQRRLASIKEKALLDKASAQRRIDQAEQDLWELTAADAPDGGKIEAKIKAIESVRADQRLVFIRAVGEAAKILTPEQLEAVTGAQPMASGKKAAPMSMH